MSIGSVMTLVGLFISLVGSTIAIAVVWGRFTEKVAALEKQVEKFEAENGKQHDEFYGTRREVDGLSSRVASMTELLKEVREDMKQLLGRMPPMAGEMGGK